MTGNNFENSVRQPKIRHFFHVLPMILAAFLFTLAGCGGGSDSSSDKPVMRSLFEATPIQFSRADAGGIIKSKSKSRFAKADAPQGPDPVPMNKWFFLVSGVGLEAVDNGASPNVLAVMDQPANGVYGPNGGNPANIVPLSSVNATAPKWALWKAIDDGDGGFYLRSATSFSVNENSSSPNPILGYGATFAAFDLGYAPEYSSITSIYWNQQDSPTGDNSGFQKWTYNSSGQFIQQDNGVLIDDGGQASVLNADAGPSTTWYAIPSYSLSYILNQPQSDPAFPSFVPPLEFELYDCSCAGTNGTCQFMVNSTTFDITLYGIGQFCSEANASMAVTSAGQQAAYKYISALYTGVAPDNEYYYDIRHFYTNTNSDAVNQAANLDISTASDNPGYFNGTSISFADWMAVKTQIHYECTYAQQVGNFYGNYTDVVNEIFIEGDMDLSSLATDMQMSASQQVSAVPMAVVEGVLYGALSEVQVVGSCFANTISMSYDVAQARSADATQNMTDAVSCAVSELYTKLANAMSFFTQSTENGKNTILGDWYKLYNVGRMAVYDGYNGLNSLCIPSQQENLVSAATKGYKLEVMQVLMAAAYALSTNVCLDNKDPFKNINTSLEGIYPTFGSTSGSWNCNYFYGIDDYKQIPTQAVINDCKNNGADQFELFNALNGWNAITVDKDITQTNFGPDGTLVTLFNASPFDLEVVVSSAKNGLIAAPQYFYNSNLNCDYVSFGEMHGLSGSTSFELRPYGFLPVWAVYDTELSLLYGGTEAFSIDSVWDEEFTAASGWNFTYNHYETDSGPTMAWFTIYQTNE